MTATTKPVIYSQMYNHGKERTGQRTMIPNSNIIDIISPTPLEVSFIETLIFYVCLDSYGEVTDSNGYTYQKTRQGAKAISDIVQVLWDIASKDEIFDKRVDEYADLLKKAVNPENKPLTVFNERRVNNFRNVNQQRKGAEKH